MQQVKYTIEDIPPSNNKFIGRNAQWNYQAVKKEWAYKINVLCNPKPTKPIKKAVVSLTYFFADKRRRDPDNYSGKMILDGLVRAGILLDDSFNNITLELNGKYDKNNPRTEIKITEISESGVPNDSTRS